ncbi:GNAT family N-acetyltransferase [Pseudoxanthomonas mexicana]|uniref:GNAT family N-acetyltransferase n=1 Tax=Pseudoxanthomonas mexicana TaxID=128785 RepID=UPI00398B6DC8
MASLSPPAWREVPTLAGDHVRLEPLAPHHAEGVGAALAGDALARLAYANVPSAADADAYVAAALEARDAGQCLPFAVFDAQGVLVGSTRLYDLHPEVPRASIGYTWYAPRVQRTGVNTEAKLLLLGHAFDSLGCISVLFETSTLNERSRAAIARLGARQEGIVRNHKRHGDGTPRDTVIFSIIDSEWQDVKRGLQDKLARHGQVSP